MLPALFSSALAVLVLGLMFARHRFTGFRSQRPEEFIGKGPVFDPRTHLNGPILCEGVLYGPLGRITSRFVAEMEGEWQGDRGVLREHFRYDDGSTQTREWRLTLGKAGAIIAEADDLDGPGAGVVAGPAVQMKYRLRLPPSAGSHVLNATDWMYLMENGTIINRSQFTKFGICVAELVATMRPAPR